MIFNSQISNQKTLELTNSVSFYYKANKKRHLLFVISKAKKYIRLLLVTPKKFILLFQVFLC